MTTFGFEGLYQFEKFRVDADGNELPGTREIISPWQGNLITDAGLNSLGSQASNYDNLLFCRIGTGNTAPANGDTALVAQVGATSTDGTGGGYDYNSTGKYVWRRVAKRFAAGSVSGVNLAEVGMGNSSSSALFSRSLIKDTGGSPTTLTLAADEVLDVLYELRCYLPANDTEVPATIDGSANTVTIRYSEKLIQLQNWAARIGFPFKIASSGSESGYSEYVMCSAVETFPSAATGWMSDGTGARATVTGGTYTADTFSISFTLSWGLTSSNFATGIGAVLVGTADGATGRERCAYGPWAYGFSTKLNKTSARTATVTIGLTWGRYTP